MDFDFSPSGRVTPERPDFPEDCLPLKARILLDLVKLHLHLPPAQQLKEPKFIIVQASQLAKKSTFQHVKYLCDQKRIQNPEFLYTVVGSRRHFPFTRNQQTTRFRLSLNRAVQFSYVPDIEYCHVAKRLRDIKLVLFDSWSQIGQNTLSQVDYFLRSANKTLDKKHYFANRTIILFGDVRLPGPINDSPLFIKVEDRETLEIENNPTELYRAFNTAFVLEDDEFDLFPTPAKQEYREFVKRLGRGNITFQDRDTLLSRVPSNMTEKQMRPFQELNLCIFPYKNDCTEHNLMKLTSTPQVKEQPQIRINNANELLVLKLGCPVVLTRNLSPDIGLCTNTFGTLIAVNFRFNGNKSREEYNVRDIEGLCIHFRNIHEGRQRLVSGIMCFEVFPMWEMINEDGNSTTFCRKFPVTTGYALTHHKIQHTELNRTFGIYLGEHELTPGLDYSTFSKLKTFKELLIMDEKNVSLRRMKVNEKNENERAKEYDRLKSLQDDYLQVNMCKFLQSRSQEQNHGREEQRAKVDEVKLVANTRRVAPWKKYRLIKYFGFKE